MSEDDIIAAYRKLKNSGENSVQGVVKWLKNSNILELVQKTEDEAMHFLGSLKAHEKVTEEQFKGLIEHYMKINDEVVAQMKTTLEEEKRQLQKVISGAARDLADKLDEKPKTPKTQPPCSLM